MIASGTELLRRLVIVPGSMISATSVEVFAENLLERSYFAETGLFLLALLPLLSTPVLPLIDFYNHLARFFVLSHLGSGSPLRHAYEAHWSLLPNIGIDVIATPLLDLVPPLLAAKLITAFIMAVLFGGVLYFHRALTGQRSLLVAILLLPLLYSYILNWGFANFLLGLGLVFWAAGFWIQARDRSWLGSPLTSLLALVIFLTHGVAFALYGLLLVALEIGFYFAAPVRKPGDLVKPLSLVLVQAILPVAIFLIWHGQEATDAATTFLSTTPENLPPLSHNGLHRLRAVLRVEEGPAYWFDVLTFAVQIAIFCFLVWRGRLTPVRQAWPLLALAVLLIAAVPSALFGVFYISDRMPLFAALCLLSTLMVAPQGWTRGTRTAASFLFLIAIARIGAVAVDWRGYEERFHEFQSLAARIPTGVPTLDVMVGSGHHETGISRCEMYGPLLVPLYGQFVPLFADPDQQPLRLAGALGQVQDRLNHLMPLPDERTGDYNPYMEAAASAGYDQLIVCGVERLNRPIPSNFAIVAHTQHFALLRVVR